MALMPTTSRPLFQVGLVALGSILLLFSLRIPPSENVPQHDTKSREHTEVTNVTTSMKILSQMKEIPQFVFLMGSEGSGHHLWSRLIETSPNKVKLKKLCLQSHAEEVRRQLYTNRLLNLSLFAGSACHPQWNGTYLVQETARKLRLTAKKLPRNLTVPLNGVFEAMSVTGEMSYPNFNSPMTCTAFRYPNVQLLYEACKKAQVSCHIILQHRNPLATLHSTTVNRGYHTIGFAIALYTSMYAAITMQLSASSPNLLEACWDFNDANPSARLGTLLGYSSKEFVKEFRKLFVQPRQVDREDVVPPHFEIPLRGLLAAYDQMVSKCLELLDE